MTVDRTPTLHETLANELYGVPIPNAADALVELVTARSYGTATILSDQEIARRLRLQSTDDALRLVAAMVGEGRLIALHDGNARRLAIPDATASAVTASRAAVAAVRDAQPCTPTEPRATPAQAAPFSPTNPMMPANQEETPAMTDPSPATDLPKGTIVVHVNVPRADHERLQRRAEAAKLPLNRYVLRAALAAIQAETIDRVKTLAALPVEVGTPATVEPSSAALPVAGLNDYGAIRVPLALFDAAGHAGMSLPAFVEEVISLGMRDYCNRTVLGAGQ